jgi:hypothetical protein
MISLRHAIPALAAALLGAGAAAAQQRPAPALGPQQQPPPTIEHARHRGLACSACHNSRRRHGEVIVRTQQDCQRCHHQGPGREQCSACHNLARLQRPQPQARAFQLSVSRDPVTISLRFDHQQHGQVPCTTCHGDALSRAATQADCAACHGQHHRPDATCTACHAGTQALARHKRTDHNACATAECHGAAGANLPSSREACLVCHHAQRPHYASRLCINCHQVRDL